MQKIPHNPPAEPQGSADFGGGGGLGSPGPSFENCFLFFLPQLLHRLIKARKDSVCSMFHLEHGVDFDRGFSNGFLHIFRPFSIFGNACKFSKSVAISVFFLRKTQDKKSVTKSIAKSVPIGPKTPSQNPSRPPGKSVVIPLS